ncbi:MAG TPA: hypothetical protein VFX28_24700 [Methylomirabilota bacterium]|nr:hypothetical protein [Methylomirabilota bacterium]
MAKVGRFESDPRAGTYCQIKLDSGEKIVVNHAKGGFKGGPLTITEVKWMGLASGETLFECDLDGLEGKALMTRLRPTSVAPDSAWATPLGILVAQIQDCHSLAEVRARCAALRTAPTPGTP